MAMISSPVWTGERDGVTLRVMLGVDEDPEQVDNVDVEIVDPSGATYAATFLTTDAIDVVLKRWERTGEYGGGRYFWCVDLVVIPRPGVDAIMAAAVELVASGDVSTVCAPL
jgi:hypothetical protein